MPPATGTDSFIGREREMAELTTALDGALEGRVGLVMLVGEPGIGKTRLTEELEAVAGDRGARVTWGACYEGGSAPPYWPPNHHPARRSRHPRPAQPPSGPAQPPS